MLITPMQFIHMAHTVFYLLPLFIISTFILAYWLIVDIILTILPDKKINISNNISKNDKKVFFTPRKPVEWFDFAGLIKTFEKVSQSTKTLSIIDKREVEGSFLHDEFKDLLANNSEYWFDFMADTGDGFNSTTSVLYAITRDTLKCKEEELPRGELLMIGGDLVYPLASEENYIDKLKAPLKLVFPDKDSLKDKWPKLIATPGNHDWYDGLTAFLRLMCQDKKIGGYQTFQKRSYFAYSIFDNIHIIGVDNQLLGDIDIPQVLYFENFIKQLQSDLKHHILLFVAEPYWYDYEFDDRGKRRQRMDSLDYLIKMLKDVGIKEKKSDIVIELIISGDLHHYARYDKLDKFKEDIEPKHFVTSGGGGAFKHITTALKNNITVPDFRCNANDSVEFKLTDKQYPDKKVSGKNRLKNLLFPLLNYKFTLIVIFLSLITIMTIIQSASILKYFALGLTPAFYLLILNSVKSLEYSDKTKWINRISFAIIFLISVGINFGFVYNCCHISNFVLLLFVCNLGMLQGFLFGLYLFIQSRFFRRNTNEASSSSIIENFNHFLRFKVTKNEIIIYVVKVEKAYNWMNITDDNLQTEISQSTDYKKFLKSKFATHEEQDISVIDEIKINLNVTNIE